MVKNSKGGSRFKKGAKHSGVQQMEEKVVFRDTSDDQHYAKVIQSLGSGRFVLHIVVNRTDGQPPLLDPTNYMGILPGRMKKQKWKNFVAPNDFVLISKRDFQAEDNKKVDIMMKYSTEATRKLIKSNEIPKGDDDETDSMFVDDGVVEVTQPAASIAAGGGNASAKDGWKVDFDDI